MLGGRPLSMLANNWTRSATCRHTTPQSASHSRPLPCSPQATTHNLAFIADGSLFQHAWPETGKLVACSSEAQDLHIACRLYNCDPDHRSRGESIFLSSPPPKKIACTLGTWKSIKVYRFAWKILCKFLGDTPWTSTLERACPPQTRPFQHSGILHLARGRRAPTSSPPPKKKLDCHQCCDGVCLVFYAARNSSDVNAVRAVELCGCRQHQLCISWQADTAACQV